MAKKKKGRTRSKQYNMYAGSDFEAIDRKLAKLGKSVNMIKEARSYLKKQMPSYIKRDKQLGKKISPSERKRLNEAQNKHVKRIRKKIDSLFSEATHNLRNL